MSLADYALHTCVDNSHSHLTKAEAYELQTLGLVEWLRGSLNNATPQVKAVLRISRYFPVRGLSCRVGGELAAMLCGHNRDIASSMLDNIRHRPSHDYERPGQCADI
jgi:hypothetical protein